MKASENLSQGRTGNCRQGRDCTCAPAPARISPPEFATAASRILAGLVLGAAVASAWFLIVGGAL